jgi:ribosomal-protein-alanine N-acetyltransferase
MNEIVLVPGAENHLETLFQFQTDKEGIQIAAFTNKDPSDREAYIGKWTRFLADPAIHLQVIFLDGKIAGSVGKFMMHGNAEVTYWIDRQHWGKGIASAALKKFLLLEKIRPIHAHVAFDNLGSQKALENAGFKKTGTGRMFANARGKEIEEFIYCLES